MKSRRYCENLRTRTGSDTDGRPGRCELSDLLEPVANQSQHLIPDE